MGFPLPSSPAPCAACVFTAQPAVQPAWRQVFGLAALAVLGSCLCFTGALYWARRRSPLISQRQPALIAVLFVHGALALFVPLREVLGEGAWPCAANVLLLHATYALAIAATAARVVTLYSRHREQARLLASSSAGLAASVRHFPPLASPLLLLKEQEELSRKLLQLQASLSESGASGVSHFLRPSRGMRCLRACLRSLQRLKYVGSSVTPTTSQSSSEGSFGEPSPLVWGIMTRVEEEGEEEGVEDEMSSTMGCDGIADTVAAAAATAAAAAAGGTLPSATATTPAIATVASSLSPTRIIATSSEGASRGEGGDAMQPASSRIDAFLERTRATTTFGQLRLCVSFAAPLAICTAARLCLDSTLWEVGDDGGVVSRMGCRFAPIDWSIIIIETTLILTLISVFVLRVRTLPDALCTCTELLSISVWGGVGALWQFIGKVDNAWDTNTITSDYGLVWAVYAHCAIALSLPALRTYSLEWRPHDEGDVHYDSSTRSNSSAGDGTGLVPQMPQMVEEEAPPVVEGTNPLHLPPGRGGGVGGGTPPRVAAPAGKDVSHSRSAPLLFAIGDSVRPQKPHLPPLPLLPFTPFPPGAANFTPAALAAAAEIVRESRTVRPAHASFSSSAPVAVASAAAALFLNAHDRIMFECGRVLQVEPVVLNQGSLSSILRALTETPLGQHFFSKTLAREFALENLRFLQDAQRYEDVSKRLLATMPKISAESVRVTGDAEMAPTAAVIVVPTSAASGFASRLLRAQRELLVNIVNTYVRPGCIFPLTLSVTTQADLVTLAQTAIDAAGISAQTAFAAVYDAALASVPSNSARLSTEDDATTTGAYDDALAAASAAATAAALFVLDGAWSQDTSCLPFDTRVFSAAKSEVRSRLLSGAVARFCASGYFKSWRLRVMNLALRLGLPPLSVSSDSGIPLGVPAQAATPKLGFSARTFSARSSFIDTGAEDMESQAGTSLTSLIA